MVSRHSRIHLAAMRLVEAISASLGTTSYIWGGFTLDIYQGRLLREHHDLDYLTVDLARLKPQFVALFARHRWPVRELSNGDLSPRRSGLKVQLGQIALVDGARWAFNGAKGYLVFPLGWLDPHPVRFCGVDVHVVRPELEYVVKICPQMFNPDWAVREQEVEAREQLRAMLKPRYPEPDHLLDQVSFWRSP